MLVQTKNHIVLDRVDRMAGRRSSTYLYVVLVILFDRGPQI